MSILPGQPPAGSNSTYTLNRSVLFGMIPLADLAWVMDQKPAVIRLFHECWLCDPYGSRWMPLSTKLKPAAFVVAKKRLSDQGLFVFKRETSIRDSRSTVCWVVKNLHGSRVKDFWKEVSTRVDTTSIDMDNTSTRVDTTSIDMDNTSTRVESISPQTLTQGGVWERSVSFQDFFKSFLKTLSRGERENFLDFGRKKASQLPKPPELPDKWIAANWQELRSQWEQTKEGSAAIAIQTDWTQHPDWATCLEEMRAGVPRFVALGTCFDNKTRRAIADWADERGLIWGEES